MKTAIKLLMVTLFIVIAVFMSLLYHAQMERMQLKYEMKIKKLEFQIEQQEQITDSLKTTYDEVITFKEETITNLNNHLATKHGRDQNSYIR